MDLKKNYVKFKIKNIINIYNISKNLLNSNFIKIYILL